MTNPYTQGYRDGLEAAAKVCEEIWQKKKKEYYEKRDGYLSDESDGAYLCEAAIRNLPVPESKQPSDVLPYDVKIGAATFKAGVSIQTLVKAATRWYEQAAESFAKEQKQPNVEDVEIALMNCKAPTLRGEMTMGEMYGRGLFTTLAKAAMRACGVKVD